MRFLVVVILLALGACTQIGPKKAIDESQISAEAKTKLDDARELIKNSKFKLAITKLSELNDNVISPLEKSIKYNLRGVAFFNMAEVEKSLANFEISEKYCPKDTILYSQVMLNMASADYKLNRYDDLKARLKLIDKASLSEAEQKKYYQLALAQGTKTEDDSLIVSSSLHLLQEAKSIDDVQKSNLYNQLTLSFKKLSDGQKIGLLDEFNNKNNIAVAHLAQIEAEQRYVSGDKSGAKDVINWLESEYNNDEVQKFTSDFKQRLDNASEISLANVGLVLPLSGEKASFGQRALSGIDTGLKVMELSENIKIHSKDSVDSPAKGAEAVSELIREQNVSLIIGGLFPDSAKAEYLEARKYGVLYISLSQINLPKEDKNQHLIEVQGSIESQVEALLSDEMIKKFGSRLGVIYPENEGGKAYVEEIWRKAEGKSLQVTSIASFPKNTHDYRNTSQIFLGLKYPRERSEELKILEDVYALEKSSIRRVQTLPPVLDFDWVFLATYPHEATQLIPTLAYYDANRIKIIGGPSWVSKSIVKEQKNLGTLYFVGDDPKDINHDMLNKFQQSYGKPATLIEILALDAMKIGTEALRATSNASSRDDFDSRLKSRGQLDGLASKWIYQEGVWLKKMNAMTITRGEIVKLFEAH